MPLKNIYTISPSEIKPGDVFAVIVTCHVTQLGLRFYRCGWPDTDMYQGVPQGMQYPNSTLADLFPSAKIWKEFMDATNLRSDSGA